MLKITAPRLVKNLREDVDWMDCISRQEDDFTECSFNGLCVEDVSKQNLSVNSCLFTNCGFIACNYRKSQFSDVVFKNCDLSNINLSGCGFYRVEFIGCKLTGTNFSESIFNHTTIRDCKGDYVIFSMSKLRNVSFNQCFLRGGGLDNCQFTNVEFSRGRVSPDLFERDRSYFFRDRRYTYRLDSRRGVERCYRNLLTSTGHRQNARHTIKD